jgi:hypothetical protein
MPDGATAAELYSVSVHVYYKAMANQRDIELDIEAFAKHLAQAIHWCSSRLPVTDPKHSLRSLPLNSQESLINLSHEQRLILVNELILKREQHLFSSKVPSSPLQSDLGGGKLLLFYPDGSLFDGAAEPASDGFFDWDYVPAWDTWVHYGNDSSGSSENCDENYLLCWIPGELIGKVDEGIAVDPGECIKWAANVDRAITKTLRAQGLLR